MLFITLIIYIVAWIPLKALVHSLSFLMNLKLPVVHGLMFLLALLLALLLAFFVHSYQPEFGPTLRKIGQTGGVRWMIFLTTLAASIFFFMILFDNSEIKYLLFPVAAVSLFNGLGIELWPRWLFNEDGAVLTVAPRLSMPEVKQEIRKDFDWKDGEQQYKLDIIVRHALYESLRETASPGDFEYWAKELVSNGLSGEIREFGLKLARLGKPFGSVEEVQLVLVFIQKNFRYQEEKDTSPRYPLVTLVDQQGDSRDITILGAAILRSMGYSVALIQLPGHFALGISRVEGMPGVVILDGQVRYTYCEITPPGWKIGELPEGFKDKDARVYPV